MGTPPRGSGNIPDAAYLKASLDQMVALLHEMNDVSKAAQEMAHSFEGVSLSVSQIKDKAKAYNNELHGTVAAFDTIEDKVKAVLDHQRKMKAVAMKAVALNAKDYEGTKQALAIMLKDTQAIVDSNKELAPIMSRHVRRIKEYQKEAEAATANVDAWEKFTHKISADMEVTSKHTMNIVKSWKGVSVSKLARDFHSMDGSIAAIVGRAPVFEKFTKYAQMRNELQNARKLRQEGHKAEYAEKKASLQDSLEHGDLSHGRPRAGGKRLKGRSYTGHLGEDQAQFDARVISREHGGSWASQAFAGRAAAKRARGEKVGSFIGWGDRMVEGGEGSFGRGVASSVMGGVESGAGMAMAAAPMIGVVMAVLDVVKNLFDKNQKMNSDVQAQLGASGIYGDQNIRTAQMNIRRNFTPNSIAPNRYGLDYDQNLALAKSLAEGGWSNRGFGRKQGQDRDMFLQGSEGTFQRNAMVWGKGAGLSSDQTMQQTMKLVTQYHQSLESTEDFFVKIDKASRASGIGIIKYMGIIDEVNDKYDRMNKLLAKTVDVMHALTASGMTTAEGLKEDFQGLTAGGGKRELATGAYLNMQTLKSPTDTAAVVEESKANFRAAAQELKAKYPELNIDMAKLNGPGGEQYLNSLSYMAAQQYGNGKDPSRAHAFADQAKGLQGLQVLKEGAMQFAHGPGTAAERSLNWETLQGQVGPTPTTDFQHTLQAVKASLAASGGRVSLSDLVTNQSKGMGSAQLDMLEKKFGINTDQIKYLRSAVNDSSVNAVQKMRDASPDEAANNPMLRGLYSRVYDMIPGAKKNATGAQQVAAVQGYLKDNANGQTIAGKLGSDKTFIEDVFGPKLADLMREAVTQADKDAQAQKAGDLAFTTSSFGDFLKHVFEQWFMDISQPLQDINAVVQRIFGKGMASATQSKQIQEALNSGLYTESKNWQVAKENGIMSDWAAYNENGKFDAKKYHDAADLEQQALDALDAQGQRGADEDAYQHGQLTAAGANRFGEMLNTYRDQFNEEHRPQNAGAAPAAPQAAPTGPTTPAGDKLAQLQKDLAANHFGGAQLGVDSYIALSRSAKFKGLRDEMKAANATLERVGDNNGGKTIYHIVYNHATVSAPTPEINQAPRNEKKKSPAQYDLPHWDHQ